MRWWPSALVCVIGVAACTRPGLREQGSGEAAWEGSPPTRWRGSCAYEVQTRWATSLPHIVRLVADASDWSIVFSAPRRFAEGRVELSPTGTGGIQGLVLDGATVRGAVLGTLEVTRRSDSTFVSIVGTKAYRDTVPLAASCRLGPIPATE